MNVIIAVINDITTDMRVLKQASVLNNLNCNVTIIGRRLKGSLLIDKPFFKIKRFSLLFSNGPFMYLGYNLRLLFGLLFRKADIYIANDLDTLFPCFIASMIHRKPLIYDSHEYFTGQHGLAERRFKHNLWKKLERYIVPKLSWMITVSDSIAELYRTEYGIDPVVIRNMAPSTQSITPKNRKELGVKEHELIVICQGSGINPGRGAEELIDAMTMTRNIKLLIIGSGDIIEDIKQNVRSKNLSEKIVFMPRMKWEIMMSYTKCCDAGLSLDKDTCINQRLSLPNKLFDYISAGIPSIVSPLPEVSAIINQYGCGVILEDVSPATIAGALNMLQDDRKFLAELKTKTHSAASELNWEKESIREQILFERVITQVKKRNK